MYICVYLFILLALADRVVFSEKDIGVSCTLSVNGRLFISPYEHLDALVSQSLSLFPDSSWEAIYFTFLVHSFTFLMPEHCRVQNPANFHYPHEYPQRCHMQIYKALTKQTVTSLTRLRVSFDLYKK